MKKQNKNILIDENSHYAIEVVFPQINTLIESQEHDEKRNILNRALDNLSSRQKEIIFMQYYEGLSIEEIQQITELKYQSIKNLTYRAMIVLRESIKKKKK
jgi:RNA polymerase sigma factor (sigma-70 family)